MIFATTSSPPDDAFHRYQTQQLVAVGRDQAAVLLSFRFAEGDVVARQEVGEADDGVEQIGRAHV